uniref:C2 calcium dependent domain containing 4B n=1 Tax=Aotus nancymaae TaxID=37293 RepID=A0A2K5DY43_AOTNA
MRLLGKLCSSAAGSAAPEPAFAIVLTPNRIPEFCIPPRLPAPCALDSPPRAAVLPRRCAAEPDLWPRAADEGVGHTDWDPRSQAALSLPHLPRVRTAYGFCALLESPHTRRKESLLASGPACTPRPGPTPTTAAACRRARARSVSSGQRGRERSRRFPVRGPGPLRAARRSSRAPLPERLEAEGTVALGRAGDVLRLAAEYCPGTGRLRLRLLRAEGLAGGVPVPRAVRCRLSLVLRPPATARRMQRRRGAQPQVSLLRSDPHKFVVKARGREANMTGRELGYFRLNGTRQGAVGQLAAS